MCNNISHANNFKSSFKIYRIMCIFYPVRIVYSPKKPKKKKKQMTELKWLCIIISFTFLFTFFPSYSFWSTPEWWFSKCNMTSVCGLGVRFWLRSETESWWWRFWNWMSPEIRLEKYWSVSISFESLQTKSKQNQSRKKIWAKNKHKRDYTNFLCQVYFYNPPHTA